MPPALVLGRREGDLDERSPFRPFRFADQGHLRFARQPVALARVTGDAGANDVLPRRGATAIPRHDVVEIQLAAVEHLAAILAGVLVPLENVVAGKLYLLLRQPIEKEQHDHARHADFPRDGGDHLMIWRGRGEIAPTFEIVGQKIVHLVA